MNNPAHGHLQIKLPDRPEHVDQDAEYCSVRVGGTWQDIRFHDYGELYRIPGLYEQLFQDLLDCQSPDIVGKLMKEQLQETDTEASALRVLDLGAGNGLVGAELRRVGVGELVGLDIIAEAADAAERDRPDVYDAYHVADVTKLSPDVRAALVANRFNTLVCVAALGYADIPPAAFRAAYNLVADGGWVTFTIKDRFLGEEDTSGFAKLMRRCEQEGVFGLRSSLRYRHRLDIAGNPLHYVAIIGTKLSDIPPHFC